MKKILKSLRPNDAVNLNIIEKNYESIYKKGEIVGYFSNEENFSGKIIECIIKNKVLEIIFSDDYANIYNCQLKQVNVSSINEYNGKWKCDERSGDIRGRLITDADGFIFVGIFTEEYPYKVYIEISR